MVQDQDLVALECPGVAGDDHGAVEDIDRLGADPDIEAFAHVR